MFHSTPSPALPHINGEGRLVEKPVQTLLICKKLSISVHFL